MEEKKEMTFLEELLYLVDDYQEEQRLKQEKAMEEQRQKRDYYLKHQCRTYAKYGNHRVRICCEKEPDKTFLGLTFEAIIAFAGENGMKYDLFAGENAVELIFKDGKPEFCEEPTEEEKELDLGDMLNLVEILETRRDTESGEDDDETAEEDLMGPLSEEEKADVVSRLRRAEAKRESKTPDYATVKADLYEALYKVKDLTAYERAELTQQLMKDLQTINALK